MLQALPTAALPRLTAVYAAAWYVSKQHDGQLLEEVPRHAGVRKTSCEQISTDGMQLWAAREYVGRDLKTDGRRSHRAKFKSIERGHSTRAPCDREQRCDVTAPRWVGPLSADLPRSSLVCIPSTVVRLNRKHEEARARTTRLRRPMLCDPTTETHAGGHSQPKACGESGGSLTLSRSRRLSPSPGLSSRQAIPRIRS